MFSFEPRGRHATPSAHWSDGQRVIVLVNLAGNRGAENLRDRLADKLVPVYFCDPASPWQLRRSSGCPIPSQTWVTAGLQGPVQR